MVEHDAGWVQQPGWRTLKEQAAVSLSSLKANLAVPALMDQN